MPQLSTQTNLSSSYLEKQLPLKTAPTSRFIAFFEDRADAINSDIWRSLGQQRHMQSMIGHSCQLEHDTRDISRNYRKQPFFIVTNKNALAFSIQETYCVTGHTPNTNQEVRPKFALCSWPAGLQQKVDMGILDLIGEGKRYMLAVGDWASFLARTLANVSNSLTPTCSNGTYSFAMVVPRNTPRACELITGSQTASSKTSPKPNGKPVYTCPGCFSHRLQRTETFRNHEDTIHTHTKIIAG